MKIFHLRSVLGVLAILSLSVGCYETGAMSVSREEFFASEPKWQNDDLPVPTKPNTLENETNSHPQDATPTSK